MTMNNIIMIIRMMFDINVIKFAWKCYKIFKDDPNFTLKKLSDSLTLAIKNEKIIKFEDKYLLHHFLPPIPTKAALSNFNAVKVLSENVYTQQCEMDRSGPASFYLCITHDCPHKCEYCSLDEKQYIPELSTDEWKNIIKDIQNMGTPIIGFTGGEPLLRNDLTELIKTVDNRSMTSLFTSGFKLTYKRCLEFKQAGLYIMGISIPSNFENLKRIDLALNSMKMSLSAKIHTVAHIAVLKKDIDYNNLVRIFKMIGSIGIKEIRIFEPILSGRLLCYTGNEILYNNKDREKLKKIVIKINHKFGFPKLSSDPYAESKDKFGCGAGTNHSYINAYGDLYPCDFLPIPFGNIKETSLKKLWENMSNILKKPQGGICLAQVINRQIKNNKVITPNTIEGSINLCKNQTKCSLPGIYEKMKGDK